VYEVVPVAATAFVQTPEIKFPETVAVIPAEGSGRFPTQGQ